MHLVTAATLGLLQCMVKRATELVPVLCTDVMTPKKPTARLGLKVIGQILDKQTTSGGEARERPQASPRKLIFPNTVLGRFFSYFL